MDYTIDIEGMHCKGCVKRVTEALSAMEGTSNVNVDLEKNQATLQAEADKITPDALIERIEDLGFDAKIAS